MSDPVLESKDLAVYAAHRPLLAGVNLRIEAGSVFGLVGPSGAGKSTLLRSLNRLNDLVPGLRVSGEVLLHGRSVNALDANDLRAKVAMLFQQPVVFPASIEANVLFGAKRLRPLRREERTDLTESALRQAALWEEVKDRLRQPATVLSVGQQQRLCLARALAVQPEVILMDEPTSALDPRSTTAIEELIHRLKKTHTIVIVTHNIAQAKRVADVVGFICVRDGSGQLVECGPAGTVLFTPKSAEAAEYLSHVE